MWGIAALTHVRLESGEFRSRSLSTGIRPPVGFTVRTTAMETHVCCWALQSIDVGRGTRVPSMRTARRMRGAFHA